MTITSFQTTNRLAKKHHISLFAARGAITIYLDFLSKRLLPIHIHEAVEKSGFNDKPENMTFEFLIPGFSQEL